MKTHISSLIQKALKGEEVVIAQAISKNMKIITPDKIFAKHPVLTIVIK